MKAFIALVTARTMEFVRDTGSFLWALFFPIAMIVGFAFGFSGGDNTLFKIGLVGGNDHDSLSGMASAIVSAAAERPVALSSGATVLVTTSIGATLLEPSDTLSEATRRADEALYVAKRNGRNGFAISPPEELPLRRRSNG